MYIQHFLYKEKVCIIVHIMCNGKLLLFGHQHQSILYTYVRIEYGHWMSCIYNNIA